MAAETPDNVSMIVAMYCYLWNDLVSIDIIIVVVSKEDCSVSGENNT